MKKFVLFCLVFSATTIFAQVSNVGFDDAMPWVRWWWNGDKVDTAELKRELKVLKDAGIGGVEINPIEFPAKRCDSLGIPSLTWLSEVWLDALEVTLREAKALGMGCDLLVGSGWPFGKETLPMEQRAQVMLTYAKEVKAGDRVLVDSIFAAVDPQVTEKNADRTFELVSLKLTPMTIRSLAEVEDLALEKGALVVPRDGMLYALVHCTSFASVINGAPGASGPILDHMNREAVRQYLEWMSTTLEGRLGPMKNWLRAYFVDSMELEGANWTDDFAEEFRKRRGYDLMPWLPFTMFKVGRLGNVERYEYGAEQSAEFKQKVRQARYDFELTKAELLDERYTQTFLDWCHPQGVKARAQAYGRGFFPLESSLGYDIPEGESWTTNYLRHRIGEEMGDEDYRRGRAYTMINKYVSSAAHQSGRRIVSAEEMTNTYRLFETTLELLKLGSDMSAFSGITHSVWHGYNYNPPEAGFPGWVQYGSYYNEQNSWWPYFHLLNEYRARISNILQHADMQTDIAIVLPIEDLWADYGVQTEPFPNYPKGSIYSQVQLLWEAIHKNGGNCDLITRRMLDQGMGERYKVILEMTADGVKYGDQVLGLPQGSHYLEWYADIQHRYGLPHAVTIAQPDRFLLQNHYKGDAGEDIFLFVNANLRQGVASDIRFAEEMTQGRTAWVYDPGKDEKLRLELEDGGTWLYLAPCQTVMIIFDNQTQGDATVWNPDYDESQHHFSIPMQWHVRLYPAIEGWIRDTVMQELVDLRQTQFADFSGRATYTAHFYLDSVVNDADQGVTYTPESLDCVWLGEVYDICELKVNGVDCGTQWYGERKYGNLNGLFHPGENTIEITVTTTLNNYVHTLRDNKVVQHFVLKRNVPTTPAGLVGYNGKIWFCG